MMDENLIEGFFLLTNEDLIFEVKGVIQPRNRVIAYVRYVPASFETERKRENIYYRKIYDLTERAEFLRRNYPKYLWYDPLSDREFQSVRLDDIKQVLNPISMVEQLRNKDVIHTIERMSLDLVDLIASKTNTKKYIGITGSILANLITDHSDIDVVIFGEENGRRVYNALSSDEELRSKLLHYHGPQLDEVTKARWGLGKRWNLLRSIESKKLLHGVFHDHPFFIRLVKFSDEIPEKYGEFIYKQQGQVTLECEVENDDDSIFTPCIYEVRCKERPTIKRLISFRGKFTEQVKTGMIVRVKGTLETVYHKFNGIRFSQVVLGENKSDFLVPIDL